MALNKKLNSNNSRYFTVVSYKTAMGQLYSWGNLPEKRIKTK